MFFASVERFDPQTNEWKMVAPMSKRRCGVGVAVLFELLYAVGGHDGQSYLNSIERYDPQTNQWSCDVAPTTSCRTSVGVAVLGKIFSNVFYKQQLTHRTLQKISYTPSVVRMVCNV